MCLLNCGGYGVDPDTYWNDKFTGVAARTAVGTVIELSSKVGPVILRYFHTKDENLKTSILNHIKHSQNNQSVHSAYMVKYV